MRILLKFGLLFSIFLSALCFILDADGKECYEIFSEFPYYYSDSGNPILKDTCPTGFETAIWYMGNHGLNWIRGFPEVDTGFGGHVAEAQTSICDRNGKLLFYTDNNDIYNSNNLIMTNGNIGISGVFAGASSTMNLIVPQPGSDSLYYLIYPDQVTDALDSLPKKLRYALIDMSQNGGLGKVIQKNVIIMDTSSERVEGIRHCNGRDWWIIGQNALTGEFRAYLLNDIGLNTQFPVISFSFFNKISTQKYWLPGYLKASFNGQYLIDVTGDLNPVTNDWINAVKLHKFDPSNGKIYDGIYINPSFPSSDFLYGAEFSPDLSKVYFNGNQLWQLDITEFDSSIIASSLKFIFFNPRKNLGSLTLGPDGKIYLTKGNLRDSFLNVINFPNRSGSACGFVENGFYLGSGTNLGSPHFAQSLMFPYKLCLQGPNIICPDTIIRYVLLDPCPHPNVKWDLPEGGEIRKIKGDTIDVYFPMPGYKKLIAAYPTACGYKSDMLKIEVKTCVEPKIDTCPTNHETDIWYMGKHGLNWAKGWPAVDTGFNTGGFRSVGEAHSSLCDKNGKLVCYSENDNIYNWSNQIMSNGSLDFKGGASSTMNLMVPMPENDSIFYFFYPAQANNSDDTFPHPLYYAIINVKANSGNGLVISKHNKLLDASSERIEGIRHCNGKDWWIIGQAAIGNEEFYVWKLTRFGLNLIPDKYSSGVISRESNYVLRGDLKSSHNGELLAEISIGFRDPVSKYFYNHLELHHFDPSNGNIYGSINIPLNKLNPKDALFTAEFSSDNLKLYVATGDILQFDLSDFDPVKIGNSLSILTPNSCCLGSPVLGKDFRIYITNANDIFTKDSSYLHTIEKPRKKGLASLFKQASFLLGSPSGITAPHFAQSMRFPYKLYIQGPTEACNDSLIRFILDDPCPHPTVDWTLLDGGDIVKQNKDTLWTRYSISGTYRIAANYSTNCGLKTDTVSIDVQSCTCNIVWQSDMKDTTICFRNSISFCFNTRSEFVQINDQYFFPNDTIHFNKLIRDTCLNVQLSTFFGCDSAFKYCINIKPPIDSTSNLVWLCDGDSILIQGQYYRTTDYVRAIYTSSSGCDSIHTTHLRYYDAPKEIFQNIRFCDHDSVWLNSSWFFRDTIIQSHQLNILGCDSLIETIKLTSYPLVATNHDTLQFCQGDSIFVQGKWYTSNQDLNFHYSNRNGCDSIHELHLIQKYISPITIQNIYICAGDSIQFENTWYKDSSWITRMETDIYGCDSIVITQVNVYPEVITSNEIYTICQGDSIQINNKWYTDSSRIMRMETDIHGCDSLHTIEIKLLPSFPPRTINFYICKGDSVFIENFWKSKEESFSIKKANPNACDSTFNYYIHLYEDVYIDLAQEESITKGEKITLKNSYSSNVASFHWYPSLGLSCTNCSNPVANPSIDTKYYLEVTDKNGCTAFDSILVRVKKKGKTIYFPNAFSPNGDNINDLWTPVLDSEAGVIQSISIFDRWGNQVYDCRQSQNCLFWNGNFNGQQCPPGVYVFQVEWNDSNGKVQLNKGDLTLIR